MQRRQEIANQAKRLYGKDSMIKNYLEEYDRDGHKGRILLIDVNCKGSSTGQIVYELFKGIKADGREAFLCYGRGKKVREKGIKKIGLDIETCLHALLARITGYNGCFSFFSTIRLINVVKSFKPDIINIHELHAYFVNIKQFLTFLKKEGIPVVWTFHCEYMYTGKCGYAYTCDKYITECRQCPAVKAYPKSLLFDRTHDMFMMKKRVLSDMNFRIITPSDSLEERVNNSFVKNKPIKTILNGVDTEIFYPRFTKRIRNLYQINDDTKVVLFVANMDDKTKGVDWVERLARELLDLNVVFVLVGGGAYSGTIMKNMIIAGRIENKVTMAEIYSMSDVYLICSHKETFSMTCAEALCCGTPIVGFECGAPERIFKGDYSEFVPYGNYEMLKSSLLKYLMW